MLLKSLLKQIAINTGSDLSDMRQQHHADLRTERINQAVDHTTNYYDMAHSDHDMQSQYSLPLSDETEMRDDIPQSSSSTNTLPSLTHAEIQQYEILQNAAIADYGEMVERQKQLTESEKLRQVIREQQQI